MLETKKEKENKEITECYCPLIVDAEWDEKEINWSGKQFFRITYKCWFYTIKDQLDEKLLTAHKEIVKRGYGLIANSLHLYKNGIFQGELLIEIKRGEINDPDVKTFMGFVHTKIYIGPVTDLPTVAKTFSFKPLNIYYSYFSCPVCTPDKNMQKTVLIGEKRFY